MLLHADDSVPMTESAFTSEATTTKVSRCMDIRMTISVCGFYGNCHDSKNILQRHELWVGVSVSRIPLQMHPDCLVSL